MNSFVSKTLLIIILLVTLSSGVIPDLLNNTAPNVFMDIASQFEPEVVPDYGETVLNEGFCHSYDFIVVGAGSAGAIVAARLSEIANWKVLLLEAGGDPPLTSRIPGLRAYMLHSSVDWGFSSKSPNVCKIKGDEGCYTARGKMLGGTSSFNWMLYIRGTAADFDEWAALGNNGWSYKDVLPYFKKYEGNTNESIVAIGDGYYHNANGPVKIESLQPNPADKLFIGALAEASLIDIIPDINADKSAGWYNIQTTSSDGVRSSTAHAYLYPNAKRPNLHIIKHAYVDRVVLDENNRARRVEFTYKGTHKLSATCTKEVIVSGGTIQSPTILMRSGIGPPEELKQHNIPPKVNLAVGENFKDHVCVALVLKSNILPESFPAPDFSATLAQYFLFRTGQLAGIQLFGGRIDSTNSSGEPDVLYEWASLPKNVPEVIRTTNRLLNLEPMDELMIETNKNYVLTYVVFYTIKPKSVGVIELDENLEADITTGYLTDENDEDTDTLLRGLRYALNLAYSKPLQKYGFSVLHFPLPECDALVYDSDEYWKCYIRHATSSGTHMVGTCKMGRDSKSVVDPQLNVYGTEGLRVVDCSVIPDNVRANTNAVAMMVGEKGAYHIKSTYLKS